MSCLVNPPKAGEPSYEQHKQVHTLLLLLLLLLLLSQLACSSAVLAGCSYKHCAVTMAATEPARAC
jgi:hypothetical protein